VVTERSGPVVFVGLNRPDKRNALDAVTVDVLHQVLDEARTEPTILVVHSTTPGTFVAGADIAELVGRDADAALAAINAGLFERLEAHRWPTIAVVDGAALGGGCELAMACDLRIASDRARFGQPELSLGIMAGAGGNWRLAQLVGTGLARQVLYCGRILEAAEALAVGLVDEVHPPEAVMEAAAAMAGTIAQRSWRALELTKLAMRLHRPATTTFDVAAQALLFESDDKRARMTAFLERRSR
jgi:enoyl-CoA hydratase/carnithine racemase